MYSTTANVADKFVACLLYLHVMCHISCVKCCVSYVMYHLSPVTCHLSLTTKTKAIDPPPANSPTMHSRLVCKEKKERKNKTLWKEKEKKRKNVFKLANISNTHFNKMSPVHRKVRFPGGHSKQ